jgi:hypothetical protein
MKDYSAITYTTGSFPEIAAANASSATAKDGTPVVKDWLDDIWGFYQALMSAASLTPSGDAEVYDDSQLLKAIQNIAGHPGEIVFFGGSGTYPATNGLRLLELQGQVVARADYPDLDDAVWCGTSQNPIAPAFYHTSDAGGTTRNSSGDYLVLPDTRGRFIRAMDIESESFVGGVDDGSNNYHAHAIQSGSLYLKSMSLDVTAGSTPVAVFESGATGAISTGNSGSNPQPDLINFRAMIRY